MPYVRVVMGAFRYSVAIFQYFSGTASGLNAHMRVTISFTRWTHGSLFLILIIFCVTSFVGLLLFRVIIIHAIIDMHRPVTKNNRI